jgi:hypothetical protein
MMYEWLVAGSVPACALSIQIDAQLQMTDQMRAVLEKKQKESEEQIKARELAERERARKFRELTYICIDILNMIQGKFVTEEEVISNIETMKTHKEVNEVHISFAERADAALGLWQFQFKGDLYKEVVAAAGGAHLCASILDRPPRGSSATAWSCSKRSPRTARALTTSWRPRWLPAPFPCPHSCRRHLVLL